MAEIRAVFWDVGGVLLTNAWDHTERDAAIARFGLDEPGFEARHKSAVAAFEKGELTLDEYLDRTVFYGERRFTRDEFKQYMFSLSKPKLEVLAFAKELASSGKYFMGTINNESRELNQSRIEKFGLREIFRVFVSSCFVGMRKPDSGIYRMALEITQIDAEKSCFIDDRAGNLETAAKLGMRTVQMNTIEQLRSDLEKVGVGV